jgi:hypothetical protein
MANITKRGNSYRIKVSCGYDMQGKQIFKSMTYKPTPGMTAKQIEKEVQKQALLFEEQCKSGLISNNPRHCIDLIKMLQQQKEREAAALGDRWEGDEWLFTQWNGEIMNSQTPMTQFSKFLARNNLKHRKFHSLRHTSATLLLYGGVNIKQVQGRLGHGDIETTNKYLHYLSEADEETANFLENMLTVHKGGADNKAV